ncbi:aldo-keto reductase-like protein [Hyaloscypha hepaticicola]|uniref:Aldo-keto reductase-like protein n=1 Tax=Hyaloscypha hepaticicola TaxID=2082293 RepID=A0A2J6Q7Z2_9HELO|nr:aldo-keto reductase-like protein [Hyaloscypha hepaticicola]
MMRYVLKVNPRLGKSGLKVSKVILGAMSFGEPSKIMGWTIPEAEALPIIKRAFDLGINTWDTADIYSIGDSERIIGKALREYKIPRERVVILSKIFGGLPEDIDSLSDEERFMKLTVNGGDMVNRVGLSRKHIFDAVDASIARLGTHLDVLQIHRLDRDTPREEIMKALNDVVESGKARYIGACTMAAWEFQTLQNIAKQNGWHQFISMQDYYSLLYRENEREMIPYCRDSGVGLIPYSPLARGLLSRPYNSEQTTRQKTDPTAEFMLGKTTSADIEIIGRVEKLAEKKGVSMATIALAWCYAREVMPIVGLGSVNRVNEAVEAINLAKAGLLEKEDIDFLEEKYIAKPAIATG